MNTATVDNYMRLLEPLDVQYKLEILVRLSTHVKDSYATTEQKDKKATLQRLFGAWNDMTDAEADVIINSKVLDDKNINLGL